jgi:acyl-CoA synthetase (AMP-forming)/AMP-acid ligase II
MSNPDFTMEQVFEVMEQMSAPGQMFSYQEKDIDGVMLRVFDHMPPTLRDYYMMGSRFADSDFVVSVDERFTYGETLSHAWRLAKALMEDIGVKKGDYVGIAMRNRPEWCFAFMAITAIGAVAVPLNGWWTTDEMEYGLSFSDTKVVLADKRRFETLKPLVDKLGLKIITTKVEEGASGAVGTYEALMAKHIEASMPNVEILPTDPATLFYTSGSTGKPKGVLSSHRASIAPIMAWGRYALAIKSLQTLRDGGDERQLVILNTVPLFHVTGSHSHFLLSFIAGRKMVTMPKWDVTLALQLIEREGVGTVHGVPTMLKEVVEAPNRDDYDLSSLLELGSGGAPRPVADVLRQKQTLSYTSPTNGYGLSETNAIGAVISRDAYVERPNSCGKPDALLVDCKIMAIDGSEVPIGEHGEVWLKSIANFTCYLNNPEASKAALENGWFKTGDVGYLDDEGYLYIVDRLKDIIIRGGENISCIEVEAAILQNDDIAEVSVFGLPDDRLGEAVSAVIYMKPNITMDSEGLSEMLTGHIANFKIPQHYFESPQSLPRLGTGKINKRALREHFTAIIANTA